MDFTYPDYYDVPMDYGSMPYDADWGSFEQIPWAPDYGGDWGFSSPEMEQFGGSFDPNMGGGQMPLSDPMQGFDPNAGGTPSQMFNPNLHPDLQAQQMMRMGLMSPQQTGQGTLMGLTGSQLGLGVQGIGGLAGLAGVIQALTGGGQAKQTTTTQREVPPPTPKQQELTNQTMQTLANIQGQAQNAELQRAITEMARGNLAISPNLVDQVTSAFTKQAGDIARASVNNARERGFSGGLDLISQAGAPVYSDQMAQLQSDISRQLVNLAMGLPAQAAQMNQGMVQGMTGGAAQNNQLAQILQQQQLAGIGSESVTKGNKPNLLDVMGPFAQTMGAFGSAGSALNSVLNPQRPQTNMQVMPMWLSGSGGQMPTASGLPY